jgi:chromosomal replication initiator protein
MVEIQKLWEQVKEYLAAKLGKTTLETWIIPLRPRLKDSRTLILEAPDNFFKDWAENHYRTIIQEAISSLGQQEITVNFSVGSVHLAPPSKPGVERSRPKSSAPETLILNPRYTFENFVLGPSNRASHAYALAVAKSPAKAYNPLFIYGGVGLGKTHLLQAICHYARANHPANLRLSYLPSEMFTNELIEAIQNRSTAAFRQKYRNTDILVIDDIRFIAGKESTQEEFFHTFNALYDAHKQIIISSDRPPREIANLQERLISRFSWGLTTDIQPPDLETRVAILKKKIEREPVSVPDEVIFFIAQLIKTNIRELEGALIRIVAYSLLEEKPITLELTREVLKDLLKEPKKLITVDFIQRCVAEEFGVSLQDLKTRRRNKTIVLPRQVAMYLSRELTDLSLPEIGNSFGGKDHTTVLYSCNKIKEDLNKNEILKNQIERVIQVIQQ